MSRPLAIVETHPIQYRAPVYRALRQKFGIPVKVIYGSDFSVAGYYDPEFRSQFAWDTDLLSGYDHTFPLHGRERRWSQLRFSLHQRARLCARHTQPWRSAASRLQSAFSPMGLVSPPGVQASLFCSAAKRRTGPKAPAPWPSAPEIFCSTRSIAAARSCFTSVAGLVPTMSATVARMKSSSSLPIASMALHSRLAKKPATPSGPRCAANSASRTTTRLSCSPASFPNAKARISCSKPFARSPLPSVPTPSSSSSATAN